MYTPVTISYAYNTKLLDENTPIAYQKIINVGAYSIMLICRDVFILLMIIESL